MLSGRWQIFFKTDPKRGEVPWSLPHSRCFCVTRSHAENPCDVGRFPLFQVFFAILLFFYYEEAGILFCCLLITHFCVFRISHVSRIMYSRMTHFCTRFLFTHYVLVKHIRVLPCKFASHLLVALKRVFMYHAFTCFRIRYHVFTYHT